MFGKNLAAAECHNKACRWSCCRDLHSEQASLFTICLEAQDELAAEALRAMCRKFGGSAKVWLRQLEHLLRRGEGEAARRLLERALAALPARKHIKACPWRFLSPTYFPDLTCCKTV